MTNASPVALVHGAGCSIGNELAKALAVEDVRLVLHPGTTSASACQETAAASGAECLPVSLSNEEVVSHVVASHGRLDYLFNCFVPTSETSADEVYAYPQQLMKRNFAAAEAMVACGSAGAIVNQFYLGCLFERTALEASVLMGKGAITGLSRDICVRFGKAGIRINTIQLGLVDLPETAGLIPDYVRARKTPVGRWGKPSEAAKFMLFLALRNGYMSGQAICFDGGLTAGNTGT